MSDSEFRDPMNVDSAGSLRLRRGLKLRFYYWLAVSLMIVATYVVIAGWYSAVLAWFDVTFPDTSYVSENDLNLDFTEAQKQTIERYLSGEMSQWDFERSFDTSKIREKRQPPSFSESFVRYFFNPWFFGITAAMLTAVVVATSYARYLEFRDYPDKMAEWLRATEVPLESDREDHQRLRAIVEDVRLSLGIPRPNIYMILADGGQRKLFLVGPSPRKASVVVSQTFGEDVQYTSVEQRLRERAGAIDNAPLKENLRLLGLAAGAEIFYELANDLWRLTAGETDKRIGFDIWNLMQYMRGVSHFTILPLLVLAIIVIMILMIIGAAGFRFSRKVVETVSSLTKDPADDPGF